MIHAIYLQEEDVVKQSMSCEVYRVWSRVLAQAFGRAFLLLFISTVYQQNLLRQMRKIILGLIAILTISVMSSYNFYCLNNPQNNRYRLSTSHQDSHLNVKQYQSIDRQGEEKKTDKLKKRKKKHKQTVTGNAIQEVDKRTKQTKHKQMNAGEETGQKQWSIKESEIKGGKQALNKQKQTQLGMDHKAKIKLKNKIQQKQGANKKQKIKTKKNIIETKVENMEEQIKEKVDDTRLQMRQTLEQSIQNTVQTQRNGQDIKVLQTPQNNGFNDDNEIKIEASQSMPVEAQVQGQLDSEITSGQIQL